MTTSEFKEPEFLKKAVQRALLGRVTANLAAFHAKLEGNLILTCAYFFHEPTEEERDYIEEVAGYIVENFPPNYFIATAVGMVGEASVLAIDWNYLRAEVYAPGKPLTMDRSDAQQIGLNPPRHLGIAG
jgi:hypothetical protein